jgi:hypothetical protein
MKFNRHFLLKQTLFLIKFQCSRVDFLKQVNFLQICIFKGLDQFDKETVNIKKISYK